MTANLHKRSKHHIVLRAFCVKLQLCPSLEGKNIIRTIWRDHRNLHYLIGEKFPWTAAEMFMQGKIQLSRDFQKQAYTEFFGENTPHHEAGQILLLNWCGSFSYDERDQLHRRIHDAGFLHRAIGRHRR